MNKIVAFVVFLAVSGGMYFLCANAHIDIFPCDTAHVDYNNSYAGTTALTRSEGTCSLLAHERGVGPSGDYDRLNTAGWAVLFAFCGGIGLVTGGLVGWMARKRS